MGKTPRDSFAKRAALRRRAIADQRDPSTTGPTGRTDLLSAAILPIGGPRSLASLSEKELIEHMGQVVESTAPEINAALKEAASRGGKIGHKIVRHLRSLGQDPDTIDDVAKYLGVKPGAGRIF